MSEIIEQPSSRIQFFNRAVVALLFLLCARLITMVTIPLNDSTEARYGEIARKMLETGNWITPQHDYGIPFWAKPPLSTWLSAISMKFLGVNEFAARFPELLLSLGVLWFVWTLAKKQSNSILAMISVLVLSGSMYFYLDAGAVMTDPSLLFCTTLSWVSFWFAITYHSKRWSYLFFAGLGLGLLAKGPISTVLVGMPIFFWVLAYNKWGALWQRLPWIMGTMLMCAIALPWYLLAEMKTPGFLEYFIVGEHIHRFLTPGWAGDKYGMAHTAHWGMIWIYAVAGIFPWSILGLHWMIKHWKNIPDISKNNDGWIGYLLISSIVPLVFFTFSSNIIYPYVIPVLPAFSLLFSEWWVRTHQKPMMIVYVSTTCAFVFLLVSGFFALKPDWVEKSHKPMVMTWRALDPEKKSQLIYWEFKTQYSAQFYSLGKAMATQNTNTLCQWLSQAQQNYIAVYSESLNEIPESIRAQWTSIKSLKVNGHDMLLYKATQTC